MKKDENSSELARLSDRGHFQINARDEIIKAIENGVPRSVFTKQYGVCRSTLSSWMRDHGSPEYQAKRQGKHLSKVEKETILRLIQQGQLTTHQARKTYGIGGDVLARWLQTAARKNPDLVIHSHGAMKKKPAEQSDLPDPGRLALEKALEEAQLKIHALNTLIDVAEEQFKIAIRKKPGAKQS
jgi:transposase-like protein